MSVGGGQCPEPAAADIIGELTAFGLSVAAAESLTGGLLLATLIDVPGASEVVRGGVVTYATDTKSSVAGVHLDLLGRRGPVDPQVALQMADGARQLFGAEIGIGTTGVAGPGPSDGVPAGTAYIAIATDRCAHARLLRLTGDRNQIRIGCVKAALAMLTQFVHTARNTLPVADVCASND